MVKNLKFWQFCHFYKIADFTLIENKYYKWPYGYMNNLYILWQKKIFCNKNKFETRGIFFKWAIAMATK